MNHSSPKIFGIGLSKTGTTSLYAALHLLGFRSATFGHLRQLQLTDWFDGDFRSDYLLDYDAITDLPIATFFKQLDLRYPNSKFVWTIRAMDDWLVSCEKAFSRPPLDDFARKVRVATYGLERFDRTTFRSIYSNHSRQVERYFSGRKNDLLVFDLIGGEGWNTLCPFVGRPRPEDSFPHVQPSYRVPGDTTPSMPSPTDRLLED